MQINNQFPDQYSLIVFTGTESGFWNSISSIFVTSETERANIQLTNIVDFLEHEKRRDIPIIEANTDSGDFSDIFEKWGVKSIPWVVVLDESNKAVLSEAPSEFLGDKILVTMNIFPTMIASPPIPADYIILDRPPSSVKHISYPRYTPFWI